MSNESIRVKDSELVHSLLPIVSGTTPPGRNVAQGKPDKFRGGIIARQAASRLDDLSQLRVDALNFIRCVNDLAQRWRERKEGNIRTTSSSQILTRRASKNTSGYIGSRGRDCEAVTSLITSSVTELLKSEGFSVGLLL